MLRFALCALVPIAVGCFETKRPLKYLTKEPTRYYQDVATNITPPPEPFGLPDVVPEAPHRLRAPNADDVWNMSLAEAIRIALANASIVRVDEQFLSRSNVVNANPLAAPSIFDPAIRQSGFTFGARGTEAALADFDTRFTTQMLWGRSERVQNSLVLSGGLPPGSTLTDETGDFDSRLEKRLATGATIGVQHDWDYSLNNRPGQLFGSAYTGILRADFRQPLWAGAGTEYTRIAGPTVGDTQLAIDQGVVIARINEDVSLADFEEDVRNLLRDVEEVYWNLALTYHLYDSEVTARNSAFETWEIVKAKLEAKAGDDREKSRSFVSAADEAQARDQYFEARARAETALADLYESETRLRRLLGLPVNDGRVIRPSDEPLTADLEPDWHTSLVSALTRRVELRRQKWRIKALDLQLRAAENLINPRFDLVSSYQRNGFGDRLIAGSDNDGFTTQGFRNAYETLSQGSHDTWSLGFEFSVPLGQRLAHTRKRNVELQLAKARAGLAAMELEIGHELAVAFQRLDRALVTARSNYSRLRAAQLREEAQRVTVGLPQGATIDEYLRSQTSVANAKANYYRSIVQYNQAIAELHFRSGTLLEEDRVHLHEGPWEPQAYKLALRRAVARSHGMNASRLMHTEPRPIAPSLAAPRGFIANEPAEPTPVLPAPEPSDQPSPLTDETVEGGPDVDANIPAVDAGPPSPTAKSGVRSVVYEAAPRREIALPTPIRAIEVRGSGTELADGGAEMPRTSGPTAGGGTE